jgi:hydrogenase expression/formation protein HypC
MCLAVPGEIIEVIDSRSALADFMGVKKKIAMDLIEDIRVGDYVIVHAGFAINKIDKKEALESIEYLKEIYGTT